MLKKKWKCYKIIKFKLMIILKIYNFLNYNIMKINYIWLIKITKFYHIKKLRIEYIKDKLKKNIVFNLFCKYYLQNNYITNKIC